MSKIHSSRKPVGSVVRAAVGKVYVAHLGAYNSGKLRGGWLVPDADSDILESQIKDALRVDNDEDFEWAVHDYDSFPNLGEHPGLDKLAAVAGLLEEHEEEVVSAALSAADNDVSDAEALLEEGYGIYKDDEDYAYSVVDDMGGVEKLTPATLGSYFDYERYGRDLMLEANNQDLKDGRIIVFNKST